jgi:hypothetical protein
MVMTGSVRIAFHKGQAQLATLAMVITAPAVAIETVSSGATPTSWTANERRARRGKADAEPEPPQRHVQWRTEYGLRDSARCRAERDEDGDLFLPFRHELRDHSVKAACGRDQHKDGNTLNTIVPTDCTKVATPMASASRRGSSTGKSAFAAENASRTDSTTSHGLARVRTWSESVFVGICVHGK